MNSQLPLRHINSTGIKIVIDVIPKRFDYVLLVPLCGIYYVGCRPCPIRPA
jgi:hypothetical protein